MEGTPLSPELLSALAAHRVDVSALIQPRSVSQQGYHVLGYGTTASGISLPTVTICANAGLAGGLAGQSGSLIGTVVDDGALCSILGQNVGSLCTLDAGLQRLSLSAQQPGDTPSAAMLSALYQRPSFDAAPANQLQQAGMHLQQLTSHSSALGNQAPGSRTAADLHAALAAMAAGSGVGGPMLQLPQGTAFLGLAGLSPSHGTAQHVLPSGMHPNLATQFDPLAAAASISDANQQAAAANTQQLVLQAAIARAAAANQLTAADTAAGVVAPMLQGSSLGVPHGLQRAAGLAMLTQQQQPQGLLQPPMGYDHGGALRPLLAGPFPQSSPVGLLPGTAPPLAPANSSTTIGGTDNSGSGPQPGLPRPMASSLYLTHKQRQQEQRAALQQQGQPAGMAGPPGLRLDCSKASPGGQGSAGGLAAAQQVRDQHSKHGLGSLQPHLASLDSDHQLGASRAGEAVPPGLQQRQEGGGSKAAAANGKGAAVASGGNEAAKGGANSAANGSWLNKKLNVRLYKTELCHTWEEQGSCRYGAKCQFAHGAEELRPVERHPRYKTEVCRHFMEEGTCPYGVRCRFIHPCTTSKDGSAGAAAAGGGAGSEVKEGQEAVPAQLRQRRLPVFQQLQETAPPGFAPLRLEDLEGVAGAGMDGRELLQPLDSASSLVGFPRDGLGSRHIGEELDGCLHGVEAWAEGQTEGAAAVGGKEAAIAHMQAALGQRSSGSSSGPAYATLQSLASQLKQAQAASMLCSAGPAGPQLPLSVDKLTAEAAVHAAMKSIMYVIKQ